jgi:dinuclear metal center YbgI/SA1388 family protein
MNPSQALNALVNYCNQRINCVGFPDYPKALNGLQVENAGTVTHIGAAVDAGRLPFEKAVAAGVDFLIVHHGLFWNPPIPLTGNAYNKIQLLLQNNIALYSAHLPLDAHPEIGNNACIAHHLEAEIDSFIFPFEGRPIGVKAAITYDRASLKNRLTALFPQQKSLEFGSAHPCRIAICSGSGSSVINQLQQNGCDTLITGEAQQHHYNLAQEAGINLYLCGHYATERFGVQALGKELANHFNLPFTFLETDCPL